uniref:Rhodanese domain-containing protein n=1 Tax=Macrostomum lignano TaxID=282301 RepID=A0A1I8JR61_9PLAT
MTEPESASANQSQSELINEEDPDACLEHDSFGAEQIAAATELSGFEDDGEADEDLFEELERLRESGFATVDEDDADDGGGGLAVAAKQLGESIWKLLCLTTSATLAPSEISAGAAQCLATCVLRCGPSVWARASGGARAASLLDEFDGLFDLPEQAELRAACRDFVRDWGRRRRRRRRSNAVGFGVDADALLQTDWSEVSACGSSSTSAAAAAATAATTIYPSPIPNVLALLTKYTPRPEPACHVFRLLLQYHEPALSSLLDSLRLPWLTLPPTGWPAYWLETWRRKLRCSPASWICTSLLVCISAMFIRSPNAAEHNAKRSRRSRRGRFVHLGAALRLPYACQPAHSVHRRSVCDAEPDADLLMALCLPVTVAEVTRDPPFTLVDVRSPDMYNRGHLAGAYNLDSGLLLSRPTEFDSALAAVVRTANGPLCVSGHGRKEEDTTTVLVAASCSVACAPVGVDSVGGGGGSGKNSYRNTGDVFSLEGEDDEEDETEELVSVSTWQRDALSSYPCSLLLGDDNQQTPGHLIIRHMYLLRLCPKQPGMAAIVVRRPLVKVVKITSKKRLPEFITFKYGDTDKDGVTHLTDMDRVVIPKAGEATKDVKMQIIKLLGGVSPQQ